MLEVHRQRATQQGLGPLALLEERLELGSPREDLAEQAVDDLEEIYAKYTETDAAEEMSLSELKLADGTTRPVTPAEPEAEAAEPETEDEAEGTIPF